MGHAPKSITLGEEHRAGPEIRSLGSKASVIGVSGVALAAILSFGGYLGGSPEHFLKSWLFAFLTILTICLGSLFFIMIQHATKAGWSASIRRMAEHVASNLQWIWVLFVPFFFLVLLGDGGKVWHWMDPAHVDPIIEGKSGFLNVPFWTVRAVIYFVVFFAASKFFVGNSVAQDDSGDPQLTLKMQKWVPGFIVLFALSLTFAAFDWAMSLEAHWFSTMFGVNLLAMSICGFFSLFCVMTFVVQRQGKMLNEVTQEHWQDMGKLLFGLGIVFHAYIGFSQYMLIWYANIPEETGWFLARQIGGWGTISLLLLFGHFVIPFVLIISKWVKRMRWALMLVAIWMLAFAWLDLFWLVMPVIPLDMMTAKTYMEVVEAHANDTTGITNPLNFTMLAGVGGIYLWMTIRRFRGHRLLAIRDPRLHEGLAFENQ